MCDVKCVLCVDDERQILSSLKRLLRKESYRVLTAITGEEGLNLLRENEVHLIMSDQRMPEMTGIKFLQQAKEINPHAIRIILSGYADVALIVDSINQGEIYRFLSKPWNDEELKTVIRQCLEHYDIVSANHRLNEEAKRHAEELEELNEELKRLNKSLEELANERTHSLQLSQEVLEKMPTPIICISREKQLMYANQSALNALPCLIGVLPGTSVEEFLPTDATDAIATCLDSGLDDEDLEVEWFDERKDAWVKRLVGDEGLRGCAFGTKEFQLSTFSLQP